MQNLHLPVYGDTEPPRPKPLHDDRVVQTPTTAVCLCYTVMFESIQWIPIKLPFICPDFILYDLFRLCNFDSRHVQKSPWKTWGADRAFFEQLLCWQFNLKMQCEILFEVWSEVWGAAIMLAANSQRMDFSLSPSFLRKQMVKNTGITAKHLQQHFWQQIQRSKFPKWGTYAILKSSLSELWNLHH